MATEVASAVKFLLVEDQPLEARALTRTLERHGEVHVAATCGQAQALVDEERFSGAIVDWKLPDGDGLELAEALLERWPRLTVAVLTAHLDRECVSRTQLMGAQYLVKPATRDNVRMFVQRALRPRTPAADLDELATMWARRHALSAAEAELLRLAVRGVPRPDLAARAGLTENTVKSYVKRVLDKCDAPSMAVLVGRILREEVTRSGS